MTKSFIRKENKNTITYINCELAEIADWLSGYLVDYDSVLKYQFIEIYYIGELFKQYKAGELHPEEIIKKVNKESEINNITIDIITELAKSLNKCNDNILDKIKQVLYEACLKEAIRIIALDYSEDDFI